MATKRKVVEKRPAGGGFDVAEFEGEVGKDPDAALLELCQAPRLGAAAEALFASGIKAAVEAGANPNSRIKAPAGGWRGIPVALLAHRGRWQSLKAILKLGANPDAGSSICDHAYARAAENAAPSRVGAEDALRCLDVLVDAGCDPNLPMRSGCLPLTTALANEQVELAGKLLAAGADPNGVDPVFGSPLTTIFSLRWAWAASEKRALDALRAAGADPARAKAPSVEAWDPPKGARGLEGGELLGALLAAGRTVDKAWRSECRAWLAAEAQRAEVAEAANAGKPVSADKRRPGL